jgi:hypothetical protein
MHTFVLPFCMPGLATNRFLVRLAAHAPKCEDNSRLGAHGCVRQ